VCLAVPAQVVEHSGPDTVTVDLHGNRVNCSTLLVPTIALGDWVLLHAGFAIQKLDAEEAKETWSVLEDAADVR